MFNSPLRYAVTTKITAVIILIVVIINLITFFNLSQYLTEQAINNQQKEMLAEASILQETFTFLSKHNQQEELHKVMSSFGNKDGVLLVALFNPRNQVIAANKAMHLESTMASLLTLDMQKEVIKKQQDMTSSLKPTVWYVENKQAIYTIAPIPISYQNSQGLQIQKNATLFLHFDVTTLTSEIENTLLTAFLPIAVVILLGGLFLVYYFHYSVGKRINHLKKLTNQFIGETKEDVANFDDDEISALFQSFNQLSSWITNVHEKLYDSREHLTNIQNSITEAIIATDAKGRITTFNITAEKLTGLAFEDVKKQAIRKHIKFIDIKKQTYIDEPFSTVLSGQAASNSFEAQLENQFKRIVVVSCSITPIKKQHKIEGIVIVLHDLTERYKLRETAASFEKNYESLFNLSRDGYVIYSNKGKVLNANPAFTKIVGYDHDLLLTMSWHQLIPQKWLFWQKMHQMNKLVTRGYTDLYEIEYQHKDGHCFFVEVQGFLLNEPASIDDAVIGAFIRNISERKEKDEHLRQYKQILSSASDLILLIDQDFIIKSANFAFLNYVDYELNQVVNQHISRVIGSKNFKKYVRNKAQRALKGESITVKVWAYFQTLGKRYIHINYSPYFDEKNVICGVVLNARDISEEKIQQEKVMAHQARQELILNNMADAVLTIDAQAVIHSVNNATETLFGYYTNELLNQNIKKLMPEKSAQKFDKLLNSQLFPQKQTSLKTSKELTAARDNGAEFPVRLSIAKLPDDNSEQSLFICTFQDLTLIRKQEQAMVRHQKMDALGKLTGGIAHDFNNILGVILGYCELLEVKLSAQPNIVKYVGNIAKAGNRGADLTRKLLSFSKVKQTNVDTININDLVLAQQDIIEKSLTAIIELHLDLAPDLAQTNLDIGSFEDMLLNMCINASHAMPKGGELFISSQNTYIDATTAKNFAVAPGNFVMLTIKDTGIGMDNETKDRIFEPFFTTKGDNGTGLGLSQVYGFLKSSGGYLTVNSVLGEGTLFNLYFPSTAKQQSLAQSQQHELDTDFLKQISHVLVVDDEVMLCEFAKEILELYDVKVYSAASAAEALDILEKNTIDVVVSDVVMPKMNGYQLADKIQQTYPQVKILLASGYQGELAKENAEREKPLPLIAKPYTATTLLSGIKTCLSDK